MGLTAHQNNETGCPTSGGICQKWGFCREREDVTSATQSRSIIVTIGRQRGFKQWCTESPRGGRSSRGGRVDVPLEDSRFARLQKGSARKVRQFPGIRVALCSRFINDYSVGVAIDGSNNGRYHR